MAEVKAQNPLQLVRESNVNQVSAKTLQILSQYKLGPKDKVKFRLLHGKPNPDTRPGKPKQIYPNITLPTSFDINEGDGGVTRVAAIKETGREGSYTVKKFWIDGSKTEGGVFTLRGDNVDHVKIFPLLILSPYRKDSPFPDSNIQPIYELVDEKRDKQVISQKKNVLKQAFDIIDALKATGDTAEYAVAFGGNIDDDPETLAGILDEQAMKDPKGFVEKANDPKIKFKSIVAIGVQKNVIQYDAQQHRYLWVGGDTIATLTRVDGGVAIDQFVDWLMTAKGGDKVAEMIRNASKKK